MAPQFNAITTTHFSLIYVRKLAKVAMDVATNEIRGFMARHTRKADLALFINIAGEERPETMMMVFSYLFLHLSPPN